MVDLLQLQPGSLATARTNQTCSVVKDAMGYGAYSQTIGVISEVFLSYHPLSEYTMHSTKVSKI